MSLKLNESCIIYTCIAQNQFYLKLVNGKLNIKFVALNCSYGGWGGGFCIFSVFSFIIKSTIFETNGKILFHHKSKLHKSKQQTWHA